MLSQLTRTGLIDGAVFGHSTSCVSIPEELVARSARELCRALPVIEEVLGLCQLLVSPSKCWFWATDLTGRRRLRSSSFLGHSQFL